MHRRGVRARGTGGCSPLTQTKPLFLGQNLIFFGQKPAVKNEKNLYQLNDKNGIHFIQQDIVPEIRDFY